MIRLLKLLLLFPLGNISPLAIPSYINVCHRNDPQLNQCFSKTMQEALPYIRDGIPEFHLPPGDPFSIDQIKLPNTSSSSLHLDIELSNATLYNLTKMQIGEFNVDLKGLRFVGSMHLPSSRLFSNYRLKGKILLFELDSKGTIDLNITDLSSNLDLQGSLFTKNGKEYGRIDKCTFTILSNKIKTYLTDLFPNNPEVNDSVNDALNVNSNVLAMELKPIVEEIVCSIISKYINKVHKIVPMNVLYPL